MSFIYQIKDWRSTYENNKSRERESCSFCCIPNKQDGLGYGELMLKPDHEALYGAFVAVVLIASKQTCGKKEAGNWISLRNGYLTTNGLPSECPLSARQLSIKCRFSESTIQKMLDVISSNEIGWIVKLPAECPPSANEMPVECPSDALEGKEGNRKKEGKEAPPSLKLSEQIKFERELERIIKELSGMGNLTDYEKGSKKYVRHQELSTRQIELRKILKVTA